MNSLLLCIIFLQMGPNFQLHKEFDIHKYNKNSDQSDKILKYDHIPSGKNRIPLAHDKDINKFIKYYTGPAKKYFQKTLGKGHYLKKMIVKKIKEKNMPESLYLLPFIESGYRYKVISSKKAVGMWQFIPFTATIMGLNIDHFIDERRDPLKSTDKALNFLNDLYKRYGDWYLALSAYNCGPGCIDRRIKKYETDNYWELREYLPRETQYYVPKFLAVYTIDRDREEFGVDPILPEADGDIFKYVLKQAVPISVISKATGLTTKEIKDLNPELISSITPPNRDNYKIKLPIAVKEQFIERFPKLVKEVKSGFIFHTLKYGETLSHLSVKYHTSTRAILSANRIRNVKKIRVGKKLLIPVDPILLSKKYQQNLNKPNSSKKMAKMFVHKIKKGESLWSISRDYGVDIKNIKKWNPNISPSKLSINQPIKLYIKRYKGGKNKLFDPREKRVIFASCKISKGESLWSIGVKYRVPIKEIKRLNRIYKTTKIQIGKKLSFYVSRDIYKKYSKNLTKKAIQ